MSRINESVMGLHARARALQKCHALLDYIIHIINSRRPYYDDKDPTYAAQGVLRQRIYAEIGLTWHDIAMFSPLSPAAEKLVKEKMLEFCDEKINYSVEHLMPGMRDSVAEKELRDEMRKAIIDAPEESLTTTVEVPKRAIDKEL